jgi:hypothetical protein
MPWRVSIIMLECELRIAETATDSLEGIGIREIALGKRPISDAYYETKTIKL